MPILKIQKLHPNAVVPGYANPGDAGMDLCTVQKITVKPKQKISVPTGIACQFPKGTVGLIWDKSGLSSKHGLKVLGGVIDEGYRGEIVVSLVNLGSKSITFEPGHKVAQMLIQPVHRPTIKLATSLSTSQRGDKGFGSSGK